MRGKDYYFGYDDPAMRALIAGVEATADPAEQAEILRAAQERIARQLRQRLPVPARQDRRRGRAARGLWANSPTQATDLTAVYWAE